MEIYPRKVLPTAQKGTDCLRAANQQVVVVVVVVAVSWQWKPCIGKWAPKRSAKRANGSRLLAGPFV